MAQLQIMDSADHFIDDTTKPGFAFWVIFYFWPYFLVPFGDYLDYFF